MQGPTSSSASGMPSAALAIDPAATSPPVHEIAEAPRRIAMRLRPSYGGHALYYAETLGWAVFPIQPSDKIPYAGTRGHLDALTDRAEIESLWAQWPKENVGIALEPSGLMVLDCDVGEGEGGSDPNGIRTHP